MSTLVSFVPDILSPTVNWEAIEKQYPQWVSLMAATPQDPGFHSEGDVWTHTKMVVDALVSHPWWHELDAVGQRVTFLGALLHDTGKPTTTKHEDDGRISSKGHSKRGSLDTRIWLWREGVPMAEREAVCALVASHQFPFYTMKKDDASLTLMKLSRQQRLDWLACVTMADALGRYTNPVHLRQEAIDAVELFRMGCEDLEVWGAPTESADPYTWQKFMNSPQTCDPRYSIVKQQQGSKVTLLSGLPGMGKDTWIKEHAKGLTVLSYDDMRETLGVQHGESTGDVVHAVWNQAKELLRAKTHFVWNATHLTPSMRKKALDLLWNYHATVDVVYVECSDEKVWRGRNRKRGDKAVPDKALDQLMLRWEPPSVDEAEYVQYWLDGVQITSEFKTLLKIGQTTNTALDFT